MKKKSKKIDYELARPVKGQRKGTPPNQSKKNPIPGSGRNRPAKGFNQITKEWDS